MRELAYRLWDKQVTGKFQAGLLRWYRNHRRELPWRTSPTPYRVWISEIMLQQTQVQTVLPYYRRFLHSFPDIRALAAASEPEVLEHWAGLGYYSRARNLHRAAKIIIANHGGRFPGSYEEIAKLPGIGRYTSGAILSIALNKAFPAVDGNVRRVISRLHGMTDPVPQRFFWDQASAWIPPGKAAEFNQAVMELGALICTPHLPACSACPVRSLCISFGQGLQDIVPPRKMKKSQEHVALVVLVLESGGSILLHRDYGNGYIPGEWGLPSRPISDAIHADSMARALASEIHRGRVVLRRCANVRHDITYRRMTCHVFHATPVRSPVRLKSLDNYHWAARLELDRYLTSSLYRKAVKAAESNSCTIS